MMQLKLCFDLTNLCDDHVVTELIVGESGCTNFGSNSSQWHTGNVVSVSSPAESVMVTFDGFKRNSLEVFNQYFLQ